jgi:2-polyprenyl-3-methyl-5-hydroxy-6-metoxy-1,4-benzoquinol methylase
MSPDKYSFEERYSLKNKFDFKYDEEILEVILEQKSSGKVLDVGCGEGGLALALAQKGFEVTCVDISETAIKKIKEEAIKRNLKINAIVGDLEEYELEANYDVIILCGILQFLQNKGSSFLEQVKESTKKEGINVVDAFVNRWLPKGEIERIYSSWEIIQKEAYFWKEYKMNYFIFKKSH